MFTLGKSFNPEIVKNKIRVMFKRTGHYSVTSQFIAGWISQNVNKSFRMEKYEYIFATLHILFDIIIS